MGVMLLKLITGKTGQNIFLTLACTIAQTMEPFHFQHVPVKSYQTDTEEDLPKVLLVKFLDDPYTSPTNVCHTTGMLLMTCIIDLIDH